MNKLKLLARIKELYETEGTNIIEYLKSVDSLKQNTIEDIMISYDFQAGSYTNQFFSDCEIRTKKKAQVEKIASIIDALPCGHQSIFEAGVGEATTFGLLLGELKKEFMFAGGADLSWSRIKYAYKFVEKVSPVPLSGRNLVMGDIFSLPLQDNSVNVLYTCHSLEPNGGHEDELLKECYRVAHDYVVLIEPAYEFANEKQRARMKKHGYVTHLYQSAKNLGYEVVSYELLGVSTNDENPTGCMIIRKSNVEGEGLAMPFGDPITHAPLEHIKNCYYSDEAQLLYPVVDGIPCLSTHQAIVATKFMD